jgi:hypothetical protein
MGYFEINVRAEAYCAAAAFEAKVIRDARFGCQESAVQSAPAVLHADSPICQA